MAINTAGAHAEASTNAPVMNLAHGLFSFAVVAASLGTAVLRSNGANALMVQLAILGTLMVITLFTLLPGTQTEMLSAPASGDERAESRARRLPVPPALLVLGSLGALAYLVENAWQSWSAVLLASGMRASVAIASSAPAVELGERGSAGLGQNFGQLKAGATDLNIESPAPAAAPRRPRPLV